MADDMSDFQVGISPSAFMRRLRPELYSDSRTGSSYQLDRTTLGYHLDTITARNQTQDFEIFCRKLCERTLCPNLRPATGPEGGGDSKADTETFPVADEIATLTYVGSANAGRERWAFAFSAKEKWADKVRSDVRGIVGTQRGYQQIYCVTARYAAAKRRAKVEDELTKLYRVPVTVLDRTWIIEQVIDGDRKDLAFNYLKAGHEIQGTGRIGPSDYSRMQQLDDIEKAIGDPDAFAGMEVQRVTEALVAAKLSRNLERPRPETDGRFTRAIRLADSHGTTRQRLEAEYERIWTGFWWFDDIKLLNESYDAFGLLVLPSEQAKNLEFLCNLTQLVINAVVHGHISVEDARLKPRIESLSARLRLMAADAQRPNNALAARTSLLVLQVSEAVVAREQATLASLWPQFSEVLKQAEGLGEFQFDQLIQMIGVFGNIAGSDAAYTQLVDEAAAFVSKRKGEAQGALVLLNRAQQIGVDDHFEVIRLLGKAAPRLAKKEYAEAFIDAMRLLAVAYRGGGLLWAARASCIFSVGSTFIEAEEDSQLPAVIVPTLMLLAWITLELRHIPDIFEVIRLVRGCATSLPLDEQSKGRVERRLDELDLVFASIILNFTTDDLGKADGWPDVLGGLGLFHSRRSLLYALGYEAELRADGWIPKEETPQNVIDTFSMLARQPASEKILRRSVILNHVGRQIYISNVVGIRIEVVHQHSEASILAAESVIGAIEAFFATALELDPVPHAESFVITIVEHADITEAGFTVDEELLTATIAWPENRLPASHSHQREVQQLLIRLAGSVFASTCYARDMPKTLDRLLRDEAVFDRIAMIVALGSTRQRAFGSNVARLTDWTSLVPNKFPLRTVRPAIVAQKTAQADRNSRTEAPEDAILPKDHRDLKVRSVINVHLWNRAGWRGVGFTRSGQNHPPILGLLFTEEPAARKIFERWAELFGSADEKNEIYIAVIKGVSATHPMHYRLMISSPLSQDFGAATRQILLTTCRIQTMQVVSDANLTKFLENYRQAGSYLLAPAVVKGAAAPEFLADLAILKHHLTVKMAAEVSDQDLEAIALHPPAHE